MPSSDAILASATTIANEWRAVAVAWHGVLAVLLTAFFCGWRPSNRVVAYVLSAPFLSVSAAAWVWGNPFNGTVFAALFLFVLATRQSPFKGSRSLRHPHPRDPWRNARRIRLGISALPGNGPLDDVRLCGSARGSSLSDTVRRDWRDADIRPARLGGVVHHARRRRSRVWRRRSIRPRRAARLRLAGGSAGAGGCPQRVRLSVNVRPNGVDFEQERGHRARSCHETLGCST